MCATFDFVVDSGDLRIEHSPSQERYEAILASATDVVTVGYLDYVSEPEQVVVTHTVITELYSGRGYAAELVATVLEDVRRSGKRVVPVCSYVRKFVAKHPEFADLIVSSPPVAGA